MTQTADIQPLSLESILEILRNQAIATPNPATSTRYLRALQSYGMQASQPAYKEPTQHGPSTLRVRSESSNSNLMGADRLSQGVTDDNSSLIIDNLSLSLTDWLVSQWLMNTPFTTASLYLDIISSLYGSAAKAGLLPPTKLFSDLKASLKALGPEGWRQGIDDEIFARALRLTKNARHLLADDHTAAQLVLYSLTHRLMPLNQVALLKKSDSSLDSSLFTLNPSRRARPRYLFPLRQSQRTPKQLSQHISEIVNALFRRSRLPQSTDPYQTVEALWAYAALRAGIPASTLVSHLGHVPLGLPVLKLSKRHSEWEGGFLTSPCRPARVASTVPVRPESTQHGTSTLRVRQAPKAQFSDCAAGLSQGDSTADNSSLIIDHLSLIGKVFLENPPRWYAMQLRPGVRFTDICRRIDQLRAPSPLTLDSSPLAEGLELFYPSEEISRLIGKKIVTRQRPFIHSVVFFRAKLTDIGRLFSKIGDLAWCYRQSARPGAPYADISDRQFQLFQQTIARFTPDYEVAATGDLELREGDRVEILGGLFAGQQATVESIVNGSDIVNGKAVSNRLEPTRRASVPNSQSAENNSSLIIDHSSLSNTIYRLNIIGDNGIDWRISVDPRLLSSAK